MYMYKTNKSVSYAYLGQPSIRKGHTIINKRFHLISIQIDSPPFCLSVTINYHKLSYFGLRASVTGAY